MGETFGLANPIMCRTLTFEAVRARWAAAPIPSVPTNQHQGEPPDLKATGNKPSGARGLFNYDDILE